MVSSTDKFDEGFMFALKLLISPSKSVRTLSNRFGIHPSGTLLTCNIQNISSKRLRENTLLKNGIWEVQEVLQYAGISGTLIIPIFIT